MSIFEWKSRITHLLMVHFGISLRDSRRDTDARFLSLLSEEREIAECTDMCKNDHPFVYVENVLSVVYSSLRL